MDYLSLQLTSLMNYRFWIKCSYNVLEDNRHKMVVVIKKASGCIPKNNEAVPHKAGMVILIYIR